MRTRQVDRNSMFTLTTVRQQPVDMWGGRKKVVFMRKKTIEFAYIKYELERVYLVICKGLFCVCVKEGLYIFWVANNITPLIIHGENNYYLYV